MTGGRAPAWLYVLGGGIGLLASAALMLEKLATLNDPAYVPTCSINPVISCGSVMDTPQAALLGFPNPLLGIGAFAVVVTTGAAMLAGFVPARWYRIGMLAGASVGTVFVHWLIFQSLYEIGALCPYCMVVWAVTIPIFWYTLLDTLTRARGLARYHSAVLALWFVSVVALLLIRFWNYWSTLAS